MFTDTVVQSLLATQRVNGIVKHLLRGRNPAISNAAETVWNTGATYAQLTTAAALEIVSASANDTAAGTGARTVALDLVDGSGVLSTVTVSMAGATPVAITGTFVGVNRARVLTAGSGLVNAGTITIRTVAGPVTKATINTGDILGTGHSADFIHTVPANSLGILKSIDFSATGVTGDLTVTLIIRDSTGLYYVPAVGKSSLYVTGFNAARGRIDLGLGLQVPAQSQIELQALVSAGAGDFVANAELLVINLATSGVSAANAFSI